MFSGITTHTGKINNIYRRNNNCILEIESNMPFKKEEIGSSISCSGTCLTLEKYKKKIARFYLSRETLKKTTFKTSKIGDIINLEKSLKFGNRISGHFVQGHVDMTTQLNKKILSGKSYLFTFRMLDNHKKYLIPKGSITINGVSLTIAKILKSEFQILMIPHTLKLTNLVNLKVKDLVNVEFDVLGKYIKNFLK
jgi:riboflavin synthase